MRLALCEWGEQEAESAPSLARLLAILDFSGSMAQKDAGEEGTRRRVDVLKESLDELVETFPNQVTAIGFNDDAFSIEPNAPMEPTGCTRLYGALQAAALQATVVQNVVLVSDGQPTDGKERESIDLVRQWRGTGIKFSVVYCGPRGGSGEQFLKKLAGAGGGAYTHCEVKVHLLVDALETALLAAPKGKVIQL